MRRVLVATTVTATGRWVYNVALAALVYSSTGSALWLAALTVGRYLPALVLSPLAAVAVRRFPLRAAVVACDVLAALVVGALTVGARTGLPVGLVVALAAAASAVTRTRVPVTASYLLELVDEDELARVNAALRATESAALVAGPLLGGALVVAGGPALGLGVTALAFVVAAAVVLSLPGRGAAPATDVGARPSDAVLGGLRAVLARGGRWYVGVAALSSLVTGVDSVLLVQLAEERLRSGAGAFGLLLAGTGVGGLLGGLVADRVGQARRPGVVAAAALTAGAVPTVAFLRLHDLGLGLVLMVPRGLGCLVAEVLALTALQRAARAVPLSRVLVGFHLVLLAMLALGATLAAAAQEVAGLTGPLLLVGAVVPLLLAVSVPVLVRGDRDGSAFAEVLSARVDVLVGLQIFDGARRVTLERLAAGMTEQSVVVGEALLRQGDPADAFWVVLEGTAVVSADAGDGPRVLRRVSGPTYAGEIGLLHQRPRTATVVAVTPLRALRADGPEFLAALSDAPVSSALIGAVARRLARGAATFAVVEGAPARDVGAGPGP